MSDTHNAPAPGNQPEARTPEGALIDQTPKLGSETTPKTEPEKKEEPTKVEGKTEPEKKVEPEKKEPPKKPSLLNKDEPGAPEKYEPFTAPEGYDLNPEVITKAETMFKELGLNQTQAQQLVSFYAENAAAAADAPYAAYEAQREAWQAEVAADPEIGKKLPQVKQTVGAALNLLGDPKLVADFKSAMDITGVGDHPAFIKAIYKLASMVTEGKHVPAGAPITPKAPGAAPKSAAQAIFPNLPSSAG